MGGYDGTGKQKSRNGSSYIGFFAGLVMGVLSSAAGSSLGFIAFPLIGLGIGILIKTLVSYPNYGNAPATDVLTLMSDPYASPLRGKPAQLQGDLIGRGDAGYAFGSDLQMQDRTGLMFLHYCSRFGPIGNFLFGMKKAKSLIGMQVHTVDWFRRGIAPWMDLIELRSDSGTVVNSYHRFWSFLVAGGLTLLGVVLLFV